AELDAWATGRRFTQGAAAEVLPDAAPAAATGPAAPVVAGDAAQGERQGVVAPPARAGRRSPRWWGAVGLGLLVLVGAGVWMTRGRERDVGQLLAAARFQQLTDFEGVEQAAAISRDGRFVAFQSDHDGQMNVWVTQVGTGRFSNLTHGSALEIVNPSVRTLGFSPDMTLVTFWARGIEGSGKAEINIWGVPLLGGPVRPYLEGVAEYDWSADGERLAYHTPAPGDPMFVRDPGPASEARQIFSAPAGLHSHFPLWAPDQPSLYFVEGAIPDRLDLWRIGAHGGTPERLTHHASQVSHPVFLGPQSVLYLVTDPDGSGPWMQTLDLSTGAGRRIGTGLDRFTSLSASADGRRIVATRSIPKTTLWRMPLAGARADITEAVRIPLTTGNGSSPRLGPDALFYLSSSGSKDSVWRLQAGIATEVWSSTEARILGPPAVERQGARIAFTVRERGRTSLRVLNADGTAARVVGGALEVQGSPAWAPDGSLTIGVVVDGAPRLFRVPLDGSTPSPLVREHSVDPGWSSPGELLVYSGADVGTTFPVHVAKADGSPSGLAPFTLTRGARHLAFLPGRRVLLFLGGDIGHKSLWQRDLETGRSQPVLALPPDVQLRDFDLSPDGHELVLEEVKDQSDLVMIDLPRR
ncbi:MAG: DNA-binding protein, partial [Myxococcaceae bacterium]